MATLTSNEITNDEPVRFQSSTRIFPVRGTLTGLPVTGDVWQMAKVPANCQVIDLWISVPVTFGTAAPGTVGDGDDVDRYILDIDAETAGVKRMVRNTAGGFTYTAEDTIDIVWGTIDTGASQTLTLHALVECM